jgi:hypothetical protein
VKTAAAGLWEHWAAAALAPSLEAQIKAHLHVENVFVLSADAEVCCTLQCVRKASEHSQDGAKQHRVEDGQTQPVLHEQTT